MNFVIENYEFRKCGSISRQNHVMSSDIMLSCYIIQFSGKKLCHLLSIHVVSYKNLFAGKKVDAEIFGM